MNPVWVILLCYIGGALIVIGGLSWADPGWWRRTPPPPPDTRTELQRAVDKFSADLNAQMMRVGQAMLPAVEKIAQQMSAQLRIIERALGGRMHAQSHPGHHVTESTTEPWRCLTCGERSIAWEIKR